MLVLPNGSLMFENWNIDGEGACASPGYRDETAAILDWLRDRNTESFATPDDGLKATIVATWHDN